MEAAQMYTSGQIDEGRKIYIVNVFILFHTALYLWLVQNKYHLYTVSTQQLNNWKILFLNKFFFESFEMKLLLKHLAWKVWLLW